ncbi:NAD(P)/FAD-dependent oxidoreductase [Croceiramulus getboli]|nr:FAD-binding protein [Flavobacteriaceae bacterium YJPT1-3]
MSTLVQIAILPEQQQDHDLIADLAFAVYRRQASGDRGKANSIQKSDYTWRIRKRSIDARQKTVKLNLQIELFEPGEELKNLATWNAHIVSEAPEVHIIGAGPAGLFAALQAIENGLKPVIYERGKDVRSRRRDLAILNKEENVNPESNYCFGEGGAGTYSDGKLYTRSKKRGNVLKSLEWLVHFGADPDILVDAHPHIGTNKLPKIIVTIREAIIGAGGEVHFESKLTDLRIENQSITAIQINQESWIDCSHLILATGHSARDIFELLHERGVRVEAKPFALGVRVEHQQALVNKMQYHGQQDNPYLPPAAYSLVEQVDGKGVYSFCMCPGGIIAPCATAQEEVVTNGWSPSKRNNPYANSGIVVAIDPEDLPEYDPNDPFVCLRFQQAIERACWEAAGKTQHVPAQRMIDFINKKRSEDFPKTSYQPGITSVDLNTILPPMIADRLRKAFVLFGKKMKGYYTNEAVLHAPESRTSSPVAIPRDPSTLQHIEIKGLYPCGEGAGYAGGIISAAIDGMNCIDALVEVSK